MEFEKVSAALLIIVLICSLLNEEEDDNFGDNAWDDMVVDVCFALLCWWLYQVLSDSLFPFAR